MRHRITAGLAVAAIIGGLVFSTTAVAQAAPMATDQPSRSLPLGSVGYDLLPLVLADVEGVLAVPADLVDGPIPLDNLRP